jgi:hypothetical protein
MEPIKSPENLTNNDKAKLVIDFFHRSIMHHAMWFAEVMHQYGRERALQVMDEAWENSYNIQITRLSKVMGFEMDGELPQPLTKLSEAKLDSLLEAMAVNWLVGDGTWFQSVEFSNGMSDAKRCNDSCWAQFAPFEAWSVKRLLGLEAEPGLEGLKKALKFRLYAYINKQSITDETDTSFVFRMNDCRVQSARKRKGMDDYPCKSGGMVEFTEFARAIDIRIKAECIGCPPDNHPEEWFCSWKFTIKE